MYVFFVNRYSLCVESRYVQNFAKLGLELEVAKAW